MKVDVLYLAWNRREFTTATWSWMLAHTNWSLVDKLVVYDDGSEDGTLEFLREAVEDAPVKAEFRISNFGSPPGVMNHYIATSEAEWFAKIDNDIALPGGWLDALTYVVKRNGTRVELLGMEAGMVELAGRDGKEWDGRYDWVGSTHIGGVGLMSVEAFKRRPPIPYRGRMGFTEWQSRYGPHRGWIVPDIHCPQLDRVPREPWMSLSEQYVANGWQREWPKYSEAWMAPYFDWLEEAA